VSIGFAPCQAVVLPMFGSALPLGKSVRELPLQVQIGRHALAKKKALAKKESPAFRRDLLALLLLNWGPN
jgi:hypothetical protein